VVDWWAGRGTGCLPRSCCPTATATATASPRRHPAVARAKDVRAGLGFAEGCRATRAPACPCPAPAPHMAMGEGLKERGGLPAGAGLPVPSMAFEWYLRAAAAAWTTANG
jgi:hypothetical protein